MRYGVGTLLKARGREWVVLPGSTEGLLKLRPLGRSVPLLRKRTFSIPCLR
jgi:hypothetical protein